MKFIVLLTCALWLSTVLAGQAFSHLFVSRQQQQRQSASQAAHLEWNAEQHRLRALHQIGASDVRCPTRERVYLPDMRSFLVTVKADYSTADALCRACGSELVLVDGSNVNRFAEAFQAAMLYGDQKLWIKSWFGEQVSTGGSCPAVFIDAIMGSRLVPINEACQTALFALCE